MTLLILEINLLSELAGVNNCPLEDGSRLVRVASSNELQPVVTYYMTLFH